ncbi:MAG: AbrB/MazE/SpoVT family DNA-binding domain-containing protein [Clostridia bacterium]|nr:AbrB/MazE/SpoVT family DNA-binding domain-containing protein [Clostridia bacterium]
MITVLRAKAQITVPKEIVFQLGLETGDKLDVFVKDGMICMVPVAVYPKQYIDKLMSEVEDIKAKIASGEQPVFDSVDAMLEHLEKQ